MWFLAATFSDSVKHKWVLGWAFLYGLKKIATLAVCAVHALLFTLQSIINLEQHQSFWESSCLGTSRSVSPRVCRTGPAVSCPATPNWGLRLRKPTGRRGSRGGRPSAGSGTAEARWRPWAEASRLVAQIWRHFRRSANLLPARSHYFRCCARRLGSFRRRASLGAARCE